MPFPIFFFVWIPGVRRRSRKIHQPIDYNGNLARFLRTAPVELAIAVRGARARDFFDPARTPPIDAVEAVVRTLSSGVRASPLVAAFADRVRALESRLASLRVQRENAGWFSRGRYRRAIRAFTAELDSVWDDMARTLERASAESASRRARPIEERPEDLAKRDARLGQAEAHIAAGRLEEACYELERAVSLDERLRPRLEETRRRADIENLRTWAERHASAGKGAESIDAYERLLRLAPDDAQARERLAELRGVRV